MVKCDEGITKYDVRMSVVQGRLGRWKLQGVVMKV